MKSKFDLAQFSFQTVLRHLEHEDNKANRIVVSMAFITAAAAAVFSKVLGDPDPHAVILDREINITVATFGIYLAFILAGTLIMLAALGPRFNLLSEWLSRPKEWSEKSSLLFSEVIAKHTYETWKRRWEETDADIESDMVNHLATETYLLARKAVYKVSMMSLARTMYRLAIMTLAFFIAVSFSERLEIGLPLGGLLASLILIETSFETLSNPAGTVGNRLSQFASKREAPIQSLLAFSTAFVGVVGLAMSGIVLAAAWE